MACKLMEMDENNWIWMELDRNVEYQSNVQGSVAATQV